MKKLRVLAITRDSINEITLSGLTPIGGKNSTGISIEGLSYDGDYAVVTQVGDALSIHPFRGSKPRQTSLRVGQVYQLDDLTLVVDHKTADLSPAENESDKLRSILTAMTLERNTKPPLEEILRVVINLCSHQQGMIISRDLDANYKVLVSDNLDASRSWLSESLIQHAIETKEAVILQNVVGSEFDTRQSLVATKFLSVFCWPLVVQGVTVGVLVTGSSTPYSGRFESVRAQTEIYISLAALVLDFHLRELRLERDLVALREQNSSSPFLTASNAVHEVCELARKVASSDLSVLVQGETGVGKEVLSRWIHQQSDRKNQSFMAVNCAAIPSELLESTLFGHKRGAFTGAVADHAGKILQAHRGTLFLDEIGDLSLSLQAKLLRVLQDGMVEPVGSNRSTEVNIRVICATHKNLIEMVRNGQFRQDLYFRIAQVTLVIPPLRERPGDVKLLALQFLKEIDSAKHLTLDAWSWLLAQTWPGNVRELKAAVSRAAVLSESNEIHSKHFLAGSSQALEPQSTRESSWLGSGDLESAKNAFVMRKIEHALQITNGNRTKAAELLGITSRTLFRYLEQRNMTGLS